MLLFNIIQYQQIPQVPDFNTSNVTIQQLCIHTDSRESNISIHLMLLFNSYLLKYQSRNLYFNTSNVTIQPYSGAHASMRCAHFNTSNVTIQPKFMPVKPVFDLNFNTSNVTIQPTILSHLFYSQFHYTHYISTFS